MFHPKSGACAFIGCTVNSYAYQNKFERDFWEALFTHGVVRIGQTLAASKARRNGKTTNSPSDPITILNRGLNLLGDPEMSIWTKTPADLEVEAPAAAPLGDSEVRVAVRAGGKPLRDARVCVWREGEVFAAGKTGNDGAAVLALRCRFPGAASLTVTARDFVPHEGAIRMGEPPAGGKGPSASLCDVGVAGPGAGGLEAGETGKVTLAAWNPGEAPLKGLKAKVLAVEGMAEVVGAEAAFPDVPARGAALSSAPVALRARRDAPPAHRVVLKVEFRDAAGNAWTESVPLAVDAPWVVRLGHAIVKPKGGESKLSVDDAGSTVDLFVELGNLGSGPARGVSAALSVQGTGVGLKNASVTVGDVPVGARVRSPAPFRLELGDSFDGSPIECKLSLSAASGPSREEEFFLEEPLEPPANLRAWGRPRSAFLAWEPVDNERITGYNVYRARAAAGPYARVNPTLLTASCFEDPGLEPISGYFYRITALDRSLNESALSEPVAARTVYGRQRDWPKETRDAVAEIAAADLDGDLDLEIGTADGMGPWVWHHTGQEVHHGGDFWTFGLFARGAVHPPTFFDLDGDGTLEIVAGARSGQAVIERNPDGSFRFTGPAGGRGDIHAWTLDGKELAGWPKKAAGALPGPAQAADLDRDGKPEVVVLSSDGTLQAFRPDGSAFGSGTLGKVSKDASTLPAIADLDGDGDLEVAGIDGDGKVYAFHHDGKPAPGFKLDAKPGEARSYVSAGDLDGDGKAELLFCGENGTRLFALRGDGSAVPGFPAAVACEKACVEPVLADLDADGRPEVVVAGGTSVFAFDGKGKALKGFPVKLPSPWAGTAAADVDGDGRVEVVVSAEDGVYAFRADGTAVPGWPLVDEEARGMDVRTDPLIADVDRDGDVEVIAGLGDRVMIWDLPAQFDPGLAEWPGFLRDAGRTSGWTPAPAAPGAPSAAGTEAPELSWAPSAGAACYHVYRGEGDGTLGRITAKPLAAAAFRDAGATGGLRFRYAVSAVSAAGRESRLSAPASWEDPRPGDLLRSAEKAEKEGNAAAAAETLRQFLKEYPRCPLADKARAALGRLGEAAGGGGAEGDRETGRFLALGDAWAAAGFKAKAADCFRKVLEADPGGPLAETARNRLAKIGG
ncbi:MAG: FG-GAP-like repeat-containing protein, partial [Planctomycetes bacterium]|jgi:hypothetical protein|nr:FG-GAP-like repeat-containing protein [Planctomycetota bacterium]